MSERHEFNVVNRSVPRVTGVAKVTGSAIYASDMTVEHMAWAKVLRSPFARARIVSIDTSAADREPGVIAVLTGACTDRPEPILRTRRQRPSAARHWAGAFRWRTSGGRHRRR